MNKIKIKIMNKQAVLSLSGGLDSSSLLLHLLKEGYDVQCLSFDYGQKHKVELEKATELVSYINNQLFLSDKPRTYNKIKHQIIKLDGLGKLLNSTLVEGGSEVPEGHYEAANMKETVVPNRNKVFSSIIQAVALSIAEKNNTECIVAMGIHAGDHQIYFDCRQEFRDSDYKAFLDGNENGHLVTYYTPYLKVDKYQVLQDGANSCVELGLDFNEIYSRTNTSYKPIFIKDSWADLNVGTWYSDYKSASSVERIEAFIKLGIPDPSKYADETGPVSWEYVVEQVSKILK